MASMGIIFYNTILQLLRVTAILSALFISSETVVGSVGADSSGLGFSYSGRHMSGPVIKQQLCNGLCACDKRLELINCTAREIKHLSSIAIPKSVVALLLDRNHISELPKGIFQRLPNLEFLGLSYNNISKIENQNICWGNKLTHLYLQVNFISDLPYKIFRNCSKLVTLKLNTNYLIIEEVARMLHYMPELDTLDLSNNQFQNSSILPSGFTYLKKLKYLYLSDVDIHNLSEDFFNGMDTSQLIELNLMKNVMLKVSNKSFQGMTSLKFLDISYTQITVQNAIDIFDGLRDSKLKQLNMMNIYVYSDKDGVLEPHMFRNLHNTSLKTLHMEGNYGGFHGSLSKNFFAHIHHLEHLFLDHNELKTIHPKTFNRLHKLKQLSLSRNYLSCLVDCQFLQTQAMFPSLENLDLSNNVIDNSAGFVYFSSHYFPKLRHLNLRKNRLTSILANTFRSLKGLRTLDLSENPIYSIEPGSFASLGKLKSLAIEDCYHIRSLSYQVFTGLTNLEMLKLNGNGIRSLSSDVWHGLPSLLQLELHNNDLGGSSSVLYNMSMSSTNLTVLDLSYNNIEIIPWKLFLKESQIAVINLTHNRITRFDGNHFSKLKQLKILDLSYNDILTLPENSLNGLENLTQFNLEGNPFHCDCELKDSQKWLNLNTEMLVHQENTKCAGPISLQGTPLLTYSSKEWNCKHIELVIIMISVIAVIVAIISILLFIKVVHCNNDNPKKHHKYSKYSNGKSSNCKELTQTESQVAINSIETVDVISPVSEHSNGDCTSHTNNDTACFSLSVSKKRKSPHKSRLKNGVIKPGNEPLMDNIHESQSSI